MKRLILFLIFSISAWGQSSSGNITATGSTCGTTNACISLYAPNQGSASITVTGTWSATLQFESSTDNVTWVSAIGYSVPTATAATSITANGVYQFNMSSLSYLRVRASAYTSGTAAILIQASSSSFASAIANSIITATVATLPAAAAGNAGWTRIVTDGTSTSDCTVGGGSTYAFCVSNGTAWANPGGGGGGTPGGSNQQVQWNNAGAFGGITNLTSDGTNVLNETISGTLTSATINNSGTITAGVLKSSTANAASAGSVRLANGDSINWRNAANSANIGLTLNSSDSFVFGTGSGNVQATSFSCLNASAPAFTANTFTLYCPPTITTAYGWSMPSGENATAGLLHLGAASGHASAATISKVDLTADVTGVLPGANGGSAYDCSLTTVLCLRDEFIGGGTTNGTIGNLGWNNNSLTTAATGIGLASVWPNLGLFQLTTNTTAGQGSYFNLSQATVVSTVADIGIQAGWTATYIFKFTGSTHERARIGFSLTSASVEPTDGIWIRYDKNVAYADTAWNLCIRAASTNYCQTTTKAFDNNFHKLKIRYVSSGVIGMTWDTDAELTFCTAASGCDKNSVTFPTATMVPVMIIANDGTAATVYAVDYFSLFITGLSR